MNYEQILAQLGQFIGTAGIILYLIKNNSEKLDSLIKDVAKLVGLHENCTVQSDHARITKIELDCVKCKILTSKRRKLS